MDVLHARNQKSQSKFCGFLIFKVSLNIKRRGLAKIVLDNVTLKVIFKFKHFQIQCFPARPMQFLLDYSFLALKNSPRICTCTVRITIFWGEINSGIWSDLRIHIPPEIFSYIKTQIYRIISNESNFVNYIGENSFYLENVKT